MVAAQELGDLALTLGGDGNGPDSGGDGTGPDPGGDGNGLGNSLSLALALTLGGNGNGNGWMGGGDGNVWVLGGVMAMAMAGSMPGSSGCSTLSIFQSVTSPCSSSSGPPGSGSGS